MIMAFNMKSSSNSNCHGNSGSGSLLASLITTPPTSNNNSVTEKSLRSDPVTNEINNFLTQLKYKRTMQDEDSDICKSAMVLTFPQVSKVIAHLVGVEKKELKAEPREMFIRLEKFFTEYVKTVKVNNGSKALELIQELFYNPEFVAFQQVLCNQPKDWVELGLPVYQDKVKMGLLVEQIQKETQEVQQSRRELAKNIGLGKKEVEVVKGRRAKKAARMGADTAKRLEIALDSYKSDKEKLEEACSKSSVSVKDKDVTDLLSRFEKLQLRHKVASEDLSKLSRNGALPPSINGATRVLTERKSYLDSLMEQIKNPSEFDLSMSPSPFNR